MSKIKLDKLVGKTWMYKTQNHYVITYKELEDQVIISTDSNMISISKEKLDEELEEFLPVDQDNSVTLFGAKPQLLISRQNDSMYSIMNECITKIKEDPTFISQAQAINRTMQTMIEIAKTEIEALKAAKG